MEGSALPSGPVTTTLCQEGVTPEAPCLGLHDQGLPSQARRPPAPVPFPCPDRFIQLQCFSICWVTAFLPGGEERSPASPVISPWPESKQCATEMPSAHSCVRSRVWNYSSPDFTQGFQGGSELCRIVPDAQDFPRLCGRRW